MLRCIFILLLVAPLAATDDYTLWKEGRRAWYRSDWDRAADAFRKLYNDYPESRHHCKAGYYLGYCYYKKGDRQQAVETFTEFIDVSNCKSETLADAKAKRLQVAFELSRQGMRGYSSVLEEGLKEENVDLRLFAAICLAQLESDAGLNVLFDIMEADEDRDRRDSAAKHILLVGSAQDKERLDTILAQQQPNTSGDKPKMVRLIIRDLNSNRETVKINLPIGLFNVAIRSLSKDQLDLIKDEAGVDLRNLDFDLESMPAGKVLVKVVDKEQEIKLFLE